MNINSNASIRNAFYPGYGIIMYTLRYNTKVPVWYRYRYMYSCIPGIYASLYALFFLRFIYPLGPGTRRAGRVR